MGGASAGAGHRLREAAGAVGVDCRGAVDPGPGGPAADHRRRRTAERHPRRGAGGGLVRTGPADGRALRRSRRKLGPRRGRLGGRGGAGLVVAGVAASGTGAAADRRAAGRLGRSSPQARHPDRAGGDRRLRRRHADACRRSRGGPGGAGGSGRDDHPRWDPLAAASRGDAVHAGGVGGAGSGAAVLPDAAAGPVDSGRRRLAGRRGRRGHPVRGADCRRRRLLPGRSGGLGGPIGGAARAADEDHRPARSCSRRGRWSWPPAG